VTDYLCAKFGYFSFSHFGFIVQTERQNHRITGRITEADDRYTHATTVGVSSEAHQSPMAMAHRRTLSVVVGT